MDMSAKLPDTPEKMKRIVGVGDITFKKYGKVFLDVITSWKSEKNDTGPGNSPRPPYGSSGADKPTRQER